MAEKNLYLNKLLSDPVYFADLCNGVLYKGKICLRPEDLTPLKGSQGVLYADRKGLKRVLERQRDVAMRAENGMCFAVIAVENQANVHYAMVVRSMLYDALDYTDQVQTITAELRGQGRQLAGDEFLSGISQDTRLMPVVTIVLYWGSEPWDGCTSLHELLGLTADAKAAPELASYIPDYRINLVNASDIGDLSRFQTHLQQIFGMLKYKKDKAALQRYAHENKDVLRSMDDTAKMALLSVLGEQKRLLRIMEETSGEEEFDMCQAIDDLIADGEVRGEKRGFERGEKQILTLINRLAADNRFDLIQKLTTDPDTRAELYEKYHL